MTTEYPEDRKKRELPEWLKKIAGYCYQAVFYHYDTPQEVKNFILSRIRG